MTMTVREMAAWFAAFEDQDAIVEVVDYNSSDGFHQQGGICRAVEFDPEVHIEYTDFRGNQFVKPDAPYYNRRTVFIGRSE